VIRDEGIARYSNVTQNALFEKVLLDSGYAIWNVARNNATGFFSHSWGGPPPTPPIFVTQESSAIAALADYAQIQAALREQKSAK